MPRLEEILVRCLHCLSLLHGRMILLRSHARPLSCQDGKFQSSNADNSVVNPSEQRAHSCPLSEESHQSCSEEDTDNHEDESLRISRQLGIEQEVSG